jgi:hypothetical protein
LPIENIKKIKMVKKGVLFCEISINISRKQAKKTKYLLGLKSGNKLYYTRIHFIPYLKYSNRLAFEVFSSTFNVPAGLYEIIIFYINDQKVYFYKKTAIKIEIKNYPCKNEYKPDLTFY